jgi:hypothetical protein
MRQGQQNRRGRGRNRKGQSPLTRSFESAGPDVKIRGTPAHIAEKYMTLARDATTSGDPVLAENYFQHAEHYNRIIMAFREQNMGPNGEQLNGGMNRGDRPYDPTDMGDDFDDDGDDGDMQQPSMAPMRQEHQPQPRMDNQRFDNHRGGNDHHRGGNNDQQRYRDRNDRNDRNSYRNDRQDRPQQSHERHDRPEQRHDRQDRGYQQQPPRPQNNDAGPAGPVEAAAPPPAPDRQPRRERFVPPTHEQPEFLRRPVRRPRREGNGAPPEEANGAPIAAEETDRD